MSDVIDTQGFRANVGIILLSSVGQVFLGRRIGGRGWQFPQGGMHEGEAVEQALYRELEEEIGLKRADVRLVGQTERWLRYRLPPQFVRRNKFPVCIGQKQRWFLLRVRQDDAPFEFHATASPEFDQWRWADWWDPVREIIYFKRPVYMRALSELAPLAFPGGEPARPAWWSEVQRADAPERRATRRRAMERKRGRR